MSNSQTRDFIVGSKDLLKKAGRVLTFPIFGVAWVFGLGVVVVLILEKWITWPFRAIAAHGARIQQKTQPEPVTSASEQSATPSKPRVRVYRKRSAFERFIEALY